MTLVIFTSQSRSFLPLLWVLRSLAPELKKSRTSRSARVLASWNDDEGNICSTSALSPGIIDYFFAHQLTMVGIDREHYFACVQWFKQHPVYKHLGNFTTLDVWDSRNFESSIGIGYWEVFSPGET